MSASLSDLKRGELRTKAEHELIATEKTYVAFMTALVEVFVQPLETWFQRLRFKMSQNNHTHGLIEQVLMQEPNIMETLFANLTQLAEFNARFLLEMKTAKRSKGNVAGAIEQSIPNLKIYSTFISNYDRSMALLKRIEEDPRAHAFLSACELQKGCGGLDLRSLLIQPVQRIPRYRLLLSEILKYTTRDDPERAALQRCLDMVVQVAATINDNIAKEKGRRRLLEVQAMYGTAQFARPTRYVMRDGVMQKICRNGRRRFHFILFNDAIAYGTEAVLKKKQYKLNREINLFDVLVVDAGSLDSASMHGDEPRGRASSDPPPLVTSPSNVSCNNRNIVLVSREKSFVIQCDNEQSARDWKADLCSCMIRSNGVAPPKGPPVSEFEIWMPSQTGNSASRQRFMIPEDIDMSTGMVHISELQSVAALSHDDYDSDDESETHRNSEVEQGGPGMANRIRRSMTPMRLRSPQTEENKRVESIAVEGKKNLFARMGLVKSKEKEAVPETPEYARRNSTGSEVERANEATTQNQHLRRSSLESDLTLTQRPLPPSPPRNGTPLLEAIPPTPIRPTGSANETRHVRQPSPVDGPPPPVPPRRPSGTATSMTALNSFDGAERGPPPVLPARIGSNQNVLQPNALSTPEQPHRRPPTPPARELIDKVAQSMASPLVQNRTPLLFAQNKARGDTDKPAKAGLNGQASQPSGPTRTTATATAAASASKSMPPPSNRPPTADLKATPIKTSGGKPNRTRPPRPLSDSSDSQHSSISESKGITLDSEAAVSKAVRAHRVAQAKKQYSARGGNLKRSESDDPAPSQSKPNLDSIRGEISPRRNSISPEKSGALSPGRGARTKVTPVKVTSTDKPSGSITPPPQASRARPARPTDANGAPSRQGKSSTLPPQHAARSEAGEFTAVKRAATRATAKASSSRTPK